MLRLQLYRFGAPCVNTWKAGKQELCRTPFFECLRTTVSHFEYTHDRRIRPEEDNDARSPTPNPTPNSMPNLTPNGEPGKSTAPVLQRTLSNGASSSTGCGASLRAAQVCSPIP